MKCLLCLGGLLRAGHTHVLFNLSFIVYILLMDAAHNQFGS
jgi:hypothetical protein